MERVLLDGSTLMAADGVLSGEQEPSAYNLVALALLVECVVLHDSVVVLDTSDDDRLFAAAETSGAGAVAVQRLSIEEVVKQYVVIEHPELTSLLYSGREISFHDKYFHRDAVDKAERELLQLLYREYRDDPELQDYLHDLTAHHESQLEARKTTYAGLQKEPPTPRCLHIVAPRIAHRFDRRTDSTSYNKNTPEDGTPLGQFVADGSLKTAWNSFVSEYVHAANSSPYRLGAMRATPGRFAPFDRSLLIRAHFYILASEVLAAPYRPDALRAPICLRYFNIDGYLFGERLVDAAEAMSKARVRKLNDFTGTSAYVALPFFLARIFHESRSVEDIIKIAQQLRESNEAARFREHLRYLRQAEGEEDIETLHREIQRYETLLRQEYGESEKSLEVIWSVGASASKAAALQTPAAAADAAVTTAKGLASVPAALSRWWYGRKVALIARTIRQGRRAGTSS